MLNALDTTVQVQELDSCETDGLVAAEHHEQAMQNLCSDELRSFI